MTLWVLEQIEKHKRNQSPVLQPRKNISNAQAFLFYLYLDTAIYRLNASFIFEGMVKSNVKIIVSWCAAYACTLTL